MIIEFRHTPVGTAGANDYYEITGIQLEIGSVATPFEHRTFQEEELRCQRYFWKLPVTIYGGAYGSSYGFLNFFSSSNNENKRSSELYCYKNIIRFL